MHKLLIVDDAPLNRRVMVAMLNRMGYQVVEAANVEAAIAVYQAEHPDVVITDLHMPADNDGIMLARAVRAMPDGKDIRIALMSGDGAINGADAALFDAILEKPILADEITRFVEGSK